LTLILDAALTSYSESELDGALIPLLTLLKRIARAAPNDVRTFMQRSLVPSVDPSTKSSSQQLNPALLPYKLLQHMQTPISTQLHDTINGMFFELADQDADALASRFGIGFTSGFLLSRNLQMPSNPSYESSIHTLNSASGAGSRSSTSSQALLTPHEAPPRPGSPVTEMISSTRKLSVTTKKEAERATEKLGKMIAEKGTVRRDGVDVVAPIAKSMSELTVVVVDDDMQSVDSKGN
jgi:hypothetical protein